MPFDPNYAGFGPAPTLLTGPNTYNGMGELGAQAHAPDTTSSFGFGTTLSAVGAITSAISSYYSAQASQNALRHQARMAKINAQISELGAQSALLQGQRQEQASRLRTAQFKSAQRVAMTANGIDLAGSPTAQNILTTTDYFGESDALAIQRNAIQSAWGYRTQAVNYRNQATGSNADAGSISPWMSAATSLVGSATRVAPRWYQSQQLRM